MKNLHKKITANFYCLLLAVYCFLFLGCLSGEESKARREIKEQYKAEEVRIHDVEEEANEKQIKVVEMIILNSPVLKGSKTDLEDGLSIAKKFYAAIQHKEEYNGIRVIISNKSNSKEMLGLSKNYYYDKALLTY